MKKLILATILAATSFNAVGDQSSNPFYADPFQGMKNTNYGNAGANLGGALAARNKRKVAEYKIRLGYKHAMQFMASCTMLAAIGEKEGNLAVRITDNLITEENKDDFKLYFAHSALEIKDILKNRRFKKNHARKVYRAIGCDEYASDIYTAYLNSK